eukprot:TRINITY_DN1220_c0_g1_i10.p1 TRINITY_DN1220_c0_g1~~TRINITY_DN1220_c0_g1_i10.p1  ORF type:complete len:580 (+),score=100.53 TRINITY_DN1220_c0_g1_i10:80-1819(+)
MFSRSCCRYLTSKAFTTRFYRGYSSLLTPRELFQVLDSHRRKGEYKQIIQVYDSFVRTNPLLVSDLGADVYSILIPTLGFSQNLKKFKEVWKTMRKSQVVPHDKMFCNALETFSAAKDWVSYSQVIQDIEMCGHRPSPKLYNIMLRELKKKKDYHSALKIVEEIRKDETVHVDQQLLNTILFVYTKVKPSQVDELWEEMKSLNFVTPVSYQILLDFYKLDPQKSNAIIWEMRERGVEMDFNNYKSLAGLYIRNEKRSHLKDLLKEMRSKGLTPNDSTYSSIISQLVNDSIFDLLEEMEQDQVPPTPNLCNQILRHFATVGESAEDIYSVLEILSDGSGFKPDAVTFSYILTAWINNPHIKPDHVLQLFQFIVDKKTTMTLGMIQPLFSLFARFGCMTYIDSLIQYMRETKIPMNTTIFTIILNYFLKSDQKSNFKSTVELINRMIENGSGVYSHQPDLPFFSTLLRFYSREGDSKKVASVINTMTGEKISSDVSVFRLLTIFYCKKRDLKALSGVVHKFRGCLGRPPHSLVNYRLLLRCYCLLSDSEKFDEIFLEMKQFSIEPDAAINLEKQNYGSFSR